MSWSETVRFDTVMATLPPLRAINLNRKHRFFVFKKKKRAHLILGTISKNREAHLRNIINSAVHYNFQNFENFWSMHLTFLFMHINKL